MAIVRLDQYFPRHRRRVVLLSVGSAFVGASLVSASLIIAAGFIWYEAILFIGLPVLLTSLMMLIIMISYALEPLDAIVRAVIQVSGQRSTSKPPELNIPRYERTGLKYVLQVIYNVAVGTQSKTPAPNIGIASPLLDHLPVGVIAMNEAGDIVYANKLAPLLEDNNGTKSIELMFENEDSLTNWSESVKETKVNDQHFWTRIPNRLPGTDGRRIFDIIANYEKNRESGVDTILLFVDKTQHYAPDEEDMDFIALAAHELRGPITVIRGYLDVLSDELGSTLQPDQKELIERLDVSASRLSGYVSNILNVSRYDRRHLQLHLHEDRLVDIYATIADDLQLRARTQNRLLSVTIPDDLPTIAADRNSLSEVLANLTDNAIKYSNEGGQVIVSAVVDGNFVKCTVQDQGIGVPASLVGNLFSKFYRSHRSRQTVSGTGLGLYISKAIIESHGGQIGLKSVEGQGSTFYFAVPIYSTVAEKLRASNNGNEGIIESSNGWIKNHSLYRG